MINCLLLTNNVWPNYCSKSTIPKKIPAKIPAKTAVPAGTGTKTSNPGLDPGITGILVEPWGGGGGGGSAKSRHVQT